MLLTIKNTKKTPINIFKFSLLNGAWRRLAVFSYKADGIRIDRYLKNKYSLGLRQACYLLLNGARFETRNDEIVVYFPTKYLDTLARTITYGTGEIKGIPILRYIFSV